MVSGAAWCVAPPLLLAALIGCLLGSLFGMGGVATLFLLIFIIASIVFFAIHIPIAGGVMLSIPVLAVIKTMWSSPIRSSRAGAKPDDEDKDDDD
jgi:hypothetical protein